MIRKAEYKGEVRSLFEWSKILGISYDKLIRRYDKGYRDEELFTTYRTIICRVCGKQFDTLSSRKKCCSKECAKQNSKNTQKIWWDKQKGIRRTEKKEKKATVTDIAVKARELGMSYGQYTAMLWLQERKVQSEG